MSTEIIAKPPVILLLETICSLESDLPIGDIARLFCSRIQLAVCI